MDSTKSEAGIGAVKFLIIENGSPTGLDWAKVGATQIFDIEPDIAVDRLQAAQDTQAKIVAALVPHFDATIAAEQAALEADPDYCTTSLGVDSTAAVMAIQEACKGTLWDELLHSDEWTDSAKIYVESQLATCRHVERLWHSDRNPENSTAANYKAAALTFHEGIN